VASSDKSHSRSRENRLYFSYLKEDTHIQTWWSRKCSFSLKKELRLKSSICIRDLTGQWTGAVNIRGDGDRKRFRLRGHWQYKQARGHYHQLPSFLIWFETWIWVLCCPVFVHSHYAEIPSSSHQRTIASEQLTLEGCRRIWTTYIYRVLTDMCSSSVTSSE
jgi:hypothetical protein